MVVGRAHRESPIRSSEAICASAGLPQTRAGTADSACRSQSAALARHRHSCPHAVWRAGSAGAGCDRRRGAARGPRSPRSREMTRAHGAAPARAGAERRDRRRSGADPAAKRASMRAGLPVLRPVSRLSREQSCRAARGAVGRPSQRRRAQADRRSSVTRSLSGSSNQVRSARQRRCGPRPATPRVEDPRDERHVSEIVNEHSSSRTSSRARTRRT